MMTNPMSSGKVIRIMIIWCALILTLDSVARERILLNKDWRFAKGHAANPEKDFGYGMALSFSKVAFLQESTILEKDQRSQLRIPHAPGFIDTAWAKINLPHDWGMGEGYSKEQFKIKGYRTLGGRSPENSVGWYRKSFEIAKDALGDRLYLEFEGVFRDAQVWVNGVYQGRHESGYTGFAFDITEAINYGARNVITVRVDATHSELWSYEGAGIYRNVWLVRTNPVHVNRYGTFLTSKVADSGGTAIVTAQVEVANTTTNEAGVEVFSTITDPSGKVVATGKNTLTALPLEVTTIAQEISVPDAVLWSVENPGMYTHVAQILRNGQEIDTYTTRFGIRTIRWDANEGFFLNGKRVQIQGVCCHQDHAGVGIGVPDGLNAWRIRQLQGYGVNSYRPSHNPPTVSVLDACDNMGMIVMDELRVLSSSAEGLSQLEEVIRRDRNHPSVILWCMGNEEPALQGNEKGLRMVRRMIDVQKKLDSTRPATAAMNGDWGNGFSLGVGVQGSNYFSIGSLDNVHKQLPGLPCLLTEEASTLTTRGEYKTLPDQCIHQSYDRDAPGWGSGAERWMRYADERPFIAGAYVWTGFDYGGEAHGFFWPGVVSNFGILDYCGFPKDSYWYYKAWWGKEPVLHILPHWNGEGLPIATGQDSVDVHIYSNMDNVELRLNGRSLGKQKVEKYDVARFRVKYVPGKLQAFGVKDGKKYTETVETTGTPAALRLVNVTGAGVATGQEITEAEPIRDNTQDVAVVTVRVVDAKGRLVPTASGRIDFSIENGRILGVGNGHPSSQEPDVFEPGKPVYRNAFHGLTQVLVQCDGSGKPVVLTACSGDMKAVSLNIAVK